MLKIVNQRKSTLIKSFRRCITSTTIRLQATEVTEFKEKYDAIKIPEKKPSREPLVKNFFLAKVDSELMAYPEAFYDTSVLKQATERRNSYQHFLKDEVYSNPNDGKNIHKLGNFGSFNLDPILVTEQLYAHNEPQSDVLSYNFFITTHQIVGDMISKHCKDETKNKYLPKMSRGELIGSICLTEKEPPKIENRPFNTFAKQTDNDSWIINGEKAYVLINDLGSSLYLVSAAIESTDRIGDFAEKAALFIVDGSAHGLSVTENCSTIGFKENAFKRVTLKFDNVEISNGK